ncbi:porin [Vibrio scophthalmi]|uniref:oligogalacturonate-specific porin KdgM family protein n=1 Tax=Vibrio scophthalmi TaxID=45658 RepID=UPI002FF18A75
MNKVSKVSVILASALAAASVSAASLDVRQEYKHDSGDYASRVKMSGSTGNHYFGAETKQKGKPFSDWQAGDNEIEYGYNFNLDDHWRVTVGMPVTFGSDNVTYKPQVRVQYKFDSGITTKLRYRHEFRDYKEGTLKEGRDGNEHSSLNASKITGNVDYTWDTWQFGFEANYKEDFFNDEWSVGNKDGKYEWDFNVKIGYKASGSAWRPYVEFGNVQCNSSCDDSTDRQLRSRVGITYSF